MSFFNPNAPDAPAGGGSQFQFGSHTPAGHFVPQQPPFTPWEQDPGYVAAQNAQHQRDAEAAAYLNQQRQAALYQYGGAGNPYSTLALLKQGDAQATQSYLNSLAARGILASGETGNQASNESKRYGLSLYNAQNALNAALNGYQQTYIGQTNADADAVNAARTAAWQNYLANPSLYPRPPGPGDLGFGSHLTSHFGGGRNQQIANRSTVGQLTGTPGYGGGGY